ncbi:MAG TPA: hypothetical protein VFB99_18695 [Vicinamibacterales bacterium]|nr:hypothetical protein [Vicinamibacterales bacterium]
MCSMLNTQNAMWLRGRWLPYVGVMIVVPLCCEAQGRLPLLDRGSPRSVAATSSHGRDSILDGAAIGFAAGAGFGIAYVSVLRDSDLDVGDYTSSALIFGGLGAAVGLGIDALFDRNSSAVGPRRVALRPRLSRKAAAIRVIMRW